MLSENMASLGGEDLLSKKTLSGNEIPFEILAQSLPESFVYRAIPNSSRPDENYDS